MAGLYPEELALLKVLHESVDSQQINKIVSIEMGSLVYQLLKIRGTDIMPVIEMGMLLCLFNYFLCLAVAFPLALTFSTRFLIFCE